MELRTHPEANNDFFESYFYYEKVTEGLGERFYEEVKEAYSNIEKNPLRKRLIKGNYRVYLLKRFPFQIVYTYNKVKERISIIAIHHNSKHPKKRFRKF